MVFGRAYPIKSAVHILRPLRSGSASNTLSVVQGSYSLTGQAAVLAVTTPASQGSYTYSGFSAGLNVGEVASQGSYSLSGQAVSFTLFRAGFNVNADQGSYSLTGQTQTLTRGVKSTAAQGSYSLSGQAQTLKVGMPAVQGSYNLTGQAATLTRVGSLFYTLPVDSGSYHYNGLTISLFGPLVAGGGMLWQQSNYHSNKPKQIHPQYPKSQHHYGHHPQQPDVKRAAAHMSKLGGEARAASLSAKQRSQIATVAAKARWK